MSGNKFIQGLVLALIAALPLSAYAEDATGAQDEIVLKNGSRVVGTVTGSRDGVVTVDTDFAGTLSINLDQIDSVQTREPVVVMLADDTVIRDEPLQIDHEQLVFATTATADQTVPLGDLLLVNPEPWELGIGYKWSGLVNFALEIERGNSDTDELDYKLETVWRSKRDRYTFKGYGEIDEANGEKNTDKWQALGKYDYFLTDPNYWGIFAAAEKDKFKDLELRYMIGPYIGRQFYDQPVFSLSAELGVSYVNEEFKISEDQDYPASNWALNISSNYMGGDSRLYIDQIGIWNLDDTSDVIVNTTFGLAFPLLWNLEAAAEILWDYDSGAVEGVDDLDETYKVRIGYTW